MAIKFGLTKENRKFVNKFIKMHEITLEEIINKCIDDWRLDYEIVKGE